MKVTFNVPITFKADVVGRTKDGRKFVLCVADFSKRKERAEKDDDFFFGYDGITELILRKMENLKEVMKTNKGLKDVKLLIFSIPKEQAEIKLPEGKTLISEVKEWIEITTKSISEESGSRRKRTKEEQFPFKVEVKVV